MTTRSPYEEALRAEMLAMRRILTELENLDPETQQRILRYLVDRYSEETKA